MRAKEDERLERLVEEQFKAQQQKIIAREKEAEFKTQQSLLRQQREKIKQVGNHYNQRVNRQTINRQRLRAPAPVHARHHRHPQSSFAQPQTSPVKFSVGSSAKGPMPVRTINGKDGSYRVSFNI
jgi:hypothetical protein